jgi:hypothetical protein
MEQGLSVKHYLAIVIRYDLMNMVCIRDPIHAILRYCTSMVYIAI